MGPGQPPASRSPTSMGLLYLTRQHLQRMHPFGSELAQLWLCWERTSSDSCQALGSARAVPRNQLLAWCSTDPHTSYGQQDPGPAVGIQAAGSSPLAPYMARGRTVSRELVHGQAQDQNPSLGNCWYRARCSSCALRYHLWRAEPAG